MTTKSKRFLLNFVQFASYLDIFASMNPDSLEALNFKEDSLNSV